MSKAFKLAYMKAAYLFLFFWSATLATSAQNHLHVNLISAKYFSPKADSILRVALPLIDSVLNAPAFKEGILIARFVNTQGLTNEEIWNLIATGREVYNGTANGAVDLILETYPDQNGNNIGTTYGSKRIVSSEAYILRNGAKCYAAHLIHEYCHTIGKGTIGFGHRHKVLNKKQRREKCQSVPYIIGDLARKILKVPTCRCECENYPQT